MFICMIILYPYHLQVVYRTASTEIVSKVHVLLASHVDYIDTKYVHTIREHVTKFKGGRISSTFFIIFRLFSLFSSMCDCK